MVAKFGDLAREVRAGWSVEAVMLHERASLVFADDVRNHGSDVVGEGVR